jgi:hypothetical protein
MGLTTEITPGITNSEVQDILNNISDNDASVDAGTPAPATEPNVTDVKTETPADPEKDKQGNVRNALRASRHAERAAREERDAALRELEELRKTVPKTDATHAVDGMSAEEFEQFKEDFPSVAQELAKVRDLQAKVDMLKTPSPSSEFKPIVYEPQIQDVIDQNEDLLAWQHDPESQDKFALAIEYDSSLLADPDWKTKPLAERFEEAVKRAKRKLSDSGVSLQDPAKVIAEAPTNRPKGISDFRGGAPANAPALDYNKMSPEDILASLPSED